MEASLKQKSKFNFLLFGQAPNVLIKYLPSILCIAIMSRAFPAFTFLYYIVPFLLLGFIMLAFGDILCNKSLKLFLILNSAFFIWTLITSIWSGYPLITLYRSFYYFLLSTGSVCTGFLLMKLNKERPFGFLLPANILVLFLSCFSLLSNIPEDAWTGGHGKGFMGFTGHQNTLASVILFTLPSVLFSFKSKINIMFRKDYEQKKIFIPVKWIAFLISALLLSLNVLFLMLTYSRAAMLSFLIIIISYFILIYKWKAVLVSVLFVVIGGTLFLFNSQFREASEKLLLKRFPSLFFSREILIKPSYDAALKGGLTGLGYGISDPNIKVPGTGGYYENGRYVREKGNSILALIEETGIIGFLIFIIPIIYALKLLINNHSTFKKLNNSTIQQYSNSVFLFSVLIALILHAQFEAWWVGVGSTELPVFYILLGNAIGIRKKH
jgi:O-antigen ligase